MNRTFEDSTGIIPMRRLVAAGLAALISSDTALAWPRQEPGTSPPPPAPDKWVYNILNPTPRDLMRPMSTDRPDTTESPYTVDAGHFQVEMSWFDYGYDASNGPWEIGQALAITPMLLKVGLLNNVDLQLGISPYLRETTTDRLTNASEVVEGYGDTLLRLKVNLWGSDGGATALALMPFINFPTANDRLTLGDIEGGLIIPLAIELPHDFALGFMAQFDYTRNPADDGYHADFTQSVTLGHDLVGELGGYLEYAGIADLSGDESYQGYFNTGLTYAVTPDLQLDAGIRVGLTEASEDFGIFAGISIRF